MHVISRKALRLFWEQHPDSETPLRRWLKAMRHTDFKNFAELRTAFPSADKVDEWIVFNIGGNKGAGHVFALALEPRSYPPSPEVGS